MTWVKSMEFLTTELFNVSSVGPRGWGRWLETIGSLLNTAVSGNLGFTVFINLHTIFSQSFTVPRYPLFSKYGTEEVTTSF